jgi:uncharacterized membrane protein YczE
LDFDARHKMPLMLCCEVLIVLLMFLDVVLYMCVKQSLRQPFGWWAYLDLACIFLSLGIFLYIYFRSSQFAENYLELVVIFARYLFQFIRLTIQLKR